MDQKHHPLNAPAAALAVALLVTGCSSPSTRPSETPPAASPVPASPGAPPGAPPEAPPPPARPQAPPREIHLSPAERSLVMQAHTLLARGDIDAASATLDRALRIEPSNPLLWIELGRVRLAERDAHQAEVCARKALLLATGDHAAQAQAGRLLAEALRAQGRNQEAQELDSRPYMH
ncbi:MAG TPA: tetratricopeptide repeat protein [Steroidobacteraceae bacterium]|nr:tetratricopeptide repeat protein [Steroidobacteraceae bacterium]